MSFFSSLPFKKYILSFITSFLITAVLLAVLSVLFAFVPIPVKAVDAVHNYSYLFSAFLTAFLCGRLASGKGFLTGIFAADIYTALLIISGIIIFKNDFSPALLATPLSLSSLCGAIGGILGINCK